MALPQPQFMMVQTAEPDLFELRAQLLALYRQCEDEVACADELRADYERRIRQADELRRTAEHRMTVVRAMLDLEFPDWRPD
jgi:hypothetical protein